MLRLMGRWMKVVLVALTVAFLMAAFHISVLQKKHPSREGSTRLLKSDAGGQGWFIVSESRRENVLNMDEDVKQQAPADWMLLGQSKVVSKKISPERQVPRKVKAEAEEQPKKKKKKADWLLT